MTESVWYLYMIRCSDNSLYTGITTDVSRRLSEHNGTGKRPGAKYLRGRAPLKLEFSVSAGNRSSASRLELLVKKLNHTEKEKLIKGERKLPALA